MKYRYFIHSFIHSKVLIKSSSCEFRKTNWKISALESASLLSSSRRSTACITTKNGTLNFFDKCFEDCKKNFKGQYSLSSTHLPCSNLWVENALIAVIYGLNFSFKVQFLKVSRIKSRRFFSAGPFFVL